jgi:hypothetical protein
MDKTINKQMIDIIVVEECYPTNAENGIEVIFDIIKKDTKG